MARVRTPVEVPELTLFPPRTGLVEPRPGWEPHPHAFSDVHLLPDGRTLEVRSMHGNANHCSGLEADENDPDVVVLTLMLARNEPRSGGSEMRTAEGYAFRARVRLTRPLAGRPVVDGSLPTPEQARAGEIRAAVSARRRYQLADDETEVVALVDALAAGDVHVVRHWTGFPLTIEEHDRVMQVQRETEELFDAGHAWLKDGRDEFAAGSIHLWEPEVAVFQVTDSGVAEGLRVALMATGWQRFEVRTVRFSDQQLKPLLRRSMDLLRDAGFDVRAGGLDTVGNRARVHIWDEDLASAVRRAEALLAAAGLPDGSYVVGG